jgi:aldose 1-epimerase
MTQIISFNNLGSKPMPFGLGFHTPLRLPFLENTDKGDYKLRLSAGKRWELSDRGLPTENLLELTDEEQLLRNEGMSVTGKAIEIALTDDALLVDGKPFHGAILRNTIENISVYYEVDKQFKHWTLWNNGGEVDYVCPEPQTWAINAPNLKLSADITGLQSINGGKNWSGTTRFYVK